MMTNPDLLVAKVFKLKYCGAGDFMAATARQGCSFVWRSIIGSKDALAAGSRWRVGNGDRISVHGDYWVMKGNQGKLKGQEGTVDNQRRVAQLIDGDGHWDETMVRELFNEYESSLILNTSIGDNTRKDIRWWGFEPSGKYTVKSCYPAQMGYYKPHEHTSNEDRKLWSRLVWQVSIPPKARVFIWRACKNFIPTVANLREHHVQVDGTCQLCWDRVATMVHAICLCPRVNRSWKDSGFWRLMKKGGHASFFEMAQAVNEGLEEEEYAVWCLLAWQIWNYICKIGHGEEESAPVPTVAACWIMWENYQKAKDTMAAEMKLGVKCGDKRWRKPNRGVYRVDVDVLYNEDAMKFGVGVIIRDWHGQILAAMARRTPQRASVMLAEIMGVVEGIVFSIKRGLDPIVIYTDSILAARLMADPEEEGDYLPDDILDMIRLARDNILVGISHMSREANRAAHRLAQSVYDDNPEMIWTENFPFWLMEIVLDDIAE